MHEKRAAHRPKKVLTEETLKEDLLIKQRPTKEAYYEDLCRRKEQRADMEQFSSAWHFLKRSLCILKRALYILKRALHILKKTLYMVRKALNILKRALYI